MVVVHLWFFVFVFMFVLSSLLGPSIWSLSLWVLLWLLWALLLLLWAWAWAGGGGGGSSGRSGGGDGGDVSHMINKYMLNK